MAFEGVLLLRMSWSLSKRLSMLVGERREADYLHLIMS